MGTAFHAFPARPAIAAALVSALILATGCKKPEDDLGLSLLDPADTLGTVRIDTNNMLAWAHADEAVRTSMLSTNMVGAYADDVFGTVRTGTATQLRLSVNNVGPANSSLVCDSLVLGLAYQSLDPIYGDPDPQVIRVYRLVEDLAADTIYKSDRMPAYDPTDLVENGPLAFTPSPTEGPVVGGDTLPPQLRIPLTRDMGNEFLALWGQPAMADNAAFLAWFKGLVIMPDDAGPAPLTGGVWRFNLLSGTSKMTLYYHDGEGVNSSFDFIFGSSSVRYSFAQFDHGAAPDPGLVELLADSSLGQNEIYVQSMGGLRAEVHFPFLEEYRESPYRTLAKAELIVPLAGDHHETYTPPDQLFAFRKAEDGTDLLLPDQVAGQGAVGGFFDEDAKEYRFNITRWVQGVILDTYPNTGLALVAGNNGISVNRVRLAGPLNGERPMRLVLTFTTY